jgi:hypothetical protein
MGATPTPELAQPINYQTGSKLRPIFRVVVLCVRGFCVCVSVCAWLLGVLCVCVCHCVGVGVVWLRARFGFGFSVAQFVV